MTLNVEKRTDIAHAIVNWEARRDAHGRLMVYDLPPDDGGGSAEVAGINERYHPHEFADLAALIKMQRYDEAEVRAAHYIAGYTDTASLWTTSTAVEAFLRDCVFNRGARGASKIFQMAIGTVKVDGMVGPITRAAAALIKPVDLLVKLRSSREYYERTVVKRNEKSHFWKGLVNRWNSALALARRYL